MMASTAAPSCQCSIDGRSRRVLIVKKLHPAVTMQSLLGTFGTYGAITGCKVFTHKSGRSAGCASVEFASHQGACTAYNALQGTQLHGKNICLQWFNHNMSSPSPPDQLLDGSSPMTDNNKYAARNSHQPSTPGPSTAFGKAPSPFSMLASSPHSPFAPNGAAIAAAAVAHQQPMAALLTGAGHRPQLKMHRQASAPLSSALQQQTSAGAYAQQPPLSSGGVGDVHDAINFAGAIATVSTPCQAARDLSVLQELATMQQQHLAALAVQQMTACNQQMDVLQASPLSPARFQQQQQQQQQAYAFVALQSQQQQLQAQLLQQQQQQVSSPAPTHSHSMLQLARSMPVDLSNSLGSLCGSSGSQLQSGSILLQQHAQRADALGLGTFEAPGSAGSAHQTSPFAVSQPDKCTASDVASEWSSSSTSLAAAPPEASTEENILADTVPASARSLKANNASYRDKKRLVDGKGAVGSWEPGMSLLPCAAGSWPPPTTLETAARAAVHSNGADDTASRAPDASALARPVAFSGPGCFPVQDQHLLNGATPELLAALQLCPSEPLPCNSDLMHASNEQIAAAAAAAAVALDQQQQLMAAAFGAQQQFQLPPMSRSQQNLNVRFSDLSGGSNGLAAKLSSMRIKAPRASDSQVVLSGCEQRNSLHRSSPMLPGANASPAQRMDTTSSSAAHAWQRGVAALTGQQLQGTSSPGPVPLGVPAAEAFRSKHKQQLQLAVPDFEYVSAPMTCTAVPGGWEHTLIGTEVLPESPAAAVMPCHVDYHAAMLAAIGGAAGSNAMPAVRSTWDNTDWSSGSGSALSALLSPAHVSNIAGRRWTDLGAPPAAGSSQLSIAAPGWGPTARDRSLSCGLGTVSEELAVSAAAAEWGIGGESRLAGITRHSSLCLDLPGGQQPSGAFDTEAGAGGCSGTAREISLSCGSNTLGSRSGEGGIAAIRKRAGISEPGNGLYSSGSFTFSPHVLQHKQLSSSAESGSTADDAIISQPFQMPAFFRPSASNQEMAHSPESGAATAAAVAGTSAPQNSPFRGNTAHQLQHSHSLPAEVGPMGCTDHQAQHEQQGRQKEDPAGYGCVFRSLWGSGAGDDP